MSAGSAAVEMNRNFPQAHKYVAIAQKAGGDLEAAIATIKYTILKLATEKKGNHSYQNTVLLMTTMLSAAVEERYPKAIQEILPLTESSTITLLQPAQGKTKNPSLSPISSRLCEAKVLTEDSSS
jgi:hypothetical protein